MATLPEVALNDPHVEAHNDERTEINSKVTAVGTINKIDGPMTQAEYDAIATPDANTLYVVSG